MPAPFSPLSSPFVRLNAAAVGETLPQPPRAELVGLLPGRPRLAIVGSRAAHGHVLRALTPLLELAGERGWSLISGGALGIDGGAHQAALALGVPQLVVLPCGRDRLYPPNHATLFGSLVASGTAGVLFPHPPHTPWARHMFASRNAIIVNLADALIVAEASLRSGSRGTGLLALARGIPTAALAGSPGCGALIGAGAHALPEPDRSDDPQTIRRFRVRTRAWLDGLDPNSTPLSDEADDQWPAHLVWLREAIRSQGPAGASADALGPPARAALASLEAELLGLICEASPGRWVVV